MRTGGIRTRLERLEAYARHFDEHALLLRRLQELTWDEQAVLCLLDDPLAGQRPKPPEEYTLAEVCEAINAGDSIPHVATTFRLTPEEFEAAKRVLAEKGFIESYAAASSE